MNDLPGTLEAIAARVDALEQRVYVLEHPAEESVRADPEQFAPIQSSVAEKTPLRQSGSVFPVLGRAMLGIAGAYVLRAVAESSSLPKLAIASLAIVNSIAWLVWAARSTGELQHVRAIYAGTSGLILAPMLWELTLHFKVLSPVAAATVLAVYVVIATLPMRKAGLASVAWIAFSAAALSALAMAIATNHILPFLASLLCASIVCEYAKLRDWNRAIWVLTATATDVLVLTLLFVYSGPQNTRAGYPELGVAALLVPGCLLFLIHATSVVIETALLHKEITVAEAIQAMIACLLAVSGIFLFARGAAEITLGVACLVLSSACYILSFGHFLASDARRNFKVFNAWSAALFVVGALWSVPSVWATSILALAALAAVLIAGRSKLSTLEFHSVTFLLSAAIISELPKYVFRELAGSQPEMTGIGIFVVSACATLCYAAGKESAGETPQQQLLHFVPAFIAACSLAALAARGSLGLASHFVTLDSFHVAFIRMFTVCALALSLAFGGSRWGRLEMTRIAYAALAFAAAKLVFEDLRHGRMEFIAGSIFLFALTLIAVPRLVRVAHENQDSFEPASTLRK